MAIEIIDNFNVFVGRNIDNRYGPYDTTVSANTAIDPIFRFKGLTVLLTGSGDQIEYWYYDGITDPDLIPKGAVASLSGTDTEIVFFSGSTQISGSSYFKYIYASQSLQHGFQTVASGLYSHAAGNGSVASGLYSYAGGNYTVATGSGQTVVGQYNTLSTSQSAFIVGDGYFDGFTTVRHNVLFVSKSHFEVNAPNTFLQGLSNISQSNVLTYNPVTGQVYYTSSTNITGTSIPVDIKDEGNFIISNPAFINFTGSGVSASVNGAGVDVYIPGGGVGTPGGDNTQIQFNGGGVFSGSSNFTFISSSNIVNLTGSMIVSGAISASFGPNTVGFYGTASWAQSASYSDTSSFSFTSSLAYTASFVTASNVWGIFGSSSVDSASFASSSISASYAETASFVLNPYPINVTGSSLYSVAPVAGVPNIPVANNSIFFGNGAGFGAPLAANSNFLGYQAGYNSAFVSNANFIGYFAGRDATYSNNSNFIGYRAGFHATASTNSNFIGTTAGEEAINAQESNFIGYYAGYQATDAQKSNFIGYTVGRSASNASYSNFLGYSAGDYAVNASHSILIGSRAGYNNLVTANNSVGPNNIILGTNITLPPASKDSINIGGLIFATGSHSDFLAVNPLPTPAGGNVGINIYPPLYNFHVSGTVAFPNLTTSSQVNVVVIDTASGQLYYTASNAIGGGGGGTPAPEDTYIQYNSGSIFGAEQPFRYIYASHSLEQGNNVTASGQYSHVQGYKSEVYGIYSHTEGDNTYAGTNRAYSASFVNNTGSLLSSYGNKASAFSVGEYILWYNGSFKGYTLIESKSYDGSITQVFVDSVSNGQYNILPVRPGVGAHSATGDQIIPVSGAHAEGYQSEALGDYSSAVGSGIAVGAGSQAIGGGLALGDNSQAVGDAYAIGVYSRAEGNSSKAIGNYSHAEGVQTQATSTGAHSEGFRTLASAIYSHAEGLSTTASGQYAHAEGNNTIASGLYQTVVGQFNVANASQSAFIIGDGTSNDNRHNLVFASASSFSIDSKALIGTSSAYALYTTAKTTTVAGLNTIYSLQTASYDGAFFDYTVISGLNARAGQIMSIWSGSEIRYTETTTTDIGSTSEFIFSVALTAGSASLQVTGSTGAIIKTIIKSI